MSQEQKWLHNTGGSEWTSISVFRCIRIELSKHYHKRRRWRQYNIPRSRKITQKLLDLELGPLLENRRWVLKYLGLLDPWEFAPCESHMYREFAPCESRVIWVDNWVRTMRASAGTNWAEKLVRTMRAAMTEIPMWWSKHRDDNA